MAELLIFPVGAEHCLEKPSGNSWASESLWPFTLRLHHLAGQSAMDRGTRSGFEIWIPSFLEVGLQQSPPSQNSSFLLFKRRLPAGLMETLNGIQEGKSTFKNMVRKLTRHIYFLPDHRRDHVSKGTAVPLRNCTQSGMETLWDLGPSNLTSAPGPVALI